MKKIKNLIVIFCIIILFTILGIIYIKVKDKVEINQQDKEGDSGQEIVYDTNKKEVVTNKTDFYTVENCINEYFDIANNNSSRYFGMGDNNEYTKIYSQDEINQNRYNLLSKRYIENNSITVQNVNSYIHILDKDINFTALDMLYINGKNVDNFLVYGMLADIDNNYIGDTYILVNLDKDNRTFAIEPITGDYNNIAQIDIIYDGNSINSNDNNIYVPIQKNDQQIAQDYFLKYKKLLQINPETVYNNFFSNDYKNKKFKSIENFKDYVDKNKEEIKNIQFDSYSVNNYTDYIEYVCMDQYENIYIFDEESIMQFELKLDTYTIPTDKFKETYDKSGNQYKVAMNIDKWIQMLNNRDYKTAYSYLDETFRNNNFESEEAFEKYMRERYPLHYDFELGENTETNGIYTQTIKLTDITGEDESIIENTIIMQLLDNYEFVMSFEVN